MELDVVSNISQDEFVKRYVGKNAPVVVRGIPFEKEQWTPDALRQTVGDLTTQVYDTLFDLEDINELSEYIDEYFGTEGPLSTDVPYVRWYNTLKDVEFPWGDEAFERLSSYWQKPLCVPDHDLIVPLTAGDATVDPVTDLFPYRGVLVAARGARTRMHRDPFCSDAVVSLFYGTKEVALYHPSRTQELVKQTDNSSFGGFIDVRESDINSLSHQPDFHGEINAGDMVYIPHGWLHDVVATEDSISVTWNFVHKAGAKEFYDYLNNQPEEDSEFEILQFFFSHAGINQASPEKMMQYCPAVN